MRFDELACISLEGEIITREQCGQVLNCPDKWVLALLDAAYKVRHHYFGNVVHIQVLTNAKSGLCAEDCHYCSQSRVSTADIEKYPLMSKDKLLKEAQRAKRLKAKRYCMALSGRGPSDREIEGLCEIISAIKENTQLSVCCSLGFLKEGQAQRLKASGLDRVNHNLNTSQRFHPKICTTHTYQDRLQTLLRCRAAGLEVCSGGIVGQGETDEDIIDLLRAVREVGAESIPLNFLIPIKGTPFEDRTHELNPRRCLKILCLARFLNPDREIRVAGGREYHLRSLQPLSLYAANSIFVSGYLTTGGQSADDALQMIADLGFALEVEGAAESPEIAVPPPLPKDPLAATGI
ncbi:MAG: biotin synthase BioB [Deltaproteobacteria bacterium]|nr:MAG: biotin synthase BioB [Deltaproteobacteria bacterium]